MRLKNFNYQFNAGPFSSKDALRQNWTTGNCRRALQYYFFAKHKFFLEPENILLPEAYFKIGKFIYRKGQRIDFEKLEPSDIVYAEKIQNKKGELINRGEQSYGKADDYILCLHSAIYIGEKGKKIWHATSIEGKSCFWPLEKFKIYYKPVAVKRLYF